MLYTLSGYFTEIFLILCLICYEPSYSSIGTYANSSNNSEEIKNIFSLSEATQSISKGAPKIGNFAEGGLINENSTSFSIITSGKNLKIMKNVSVPTSSIKRQNISSFYTNLTQNRSYNFLGLSSVKLLPTKLTETESNLFLGVPEVVHINRTSVKSRKGVNYNKIVPRKGVDNEIEASHGFPGNLSCLWLSESECYSTKEIKGLECLCCKEGNTLGKAIKQQTPLNCKNCKSGDVLSSESKQDCKNICCNSIVHDIFSVTTNQDIYKKYLNYQTSIDKKQSSTLVSEISGEIRGSDFLKNMVTEVNDSFYNLKKNSKLKPSITKVPYDVVVVTEILSKDQQKVFVPIVVSLFLLPLIGILIYFIWQRIKEYWNKRYYKRMDFLIDGMYND